jgi:hypothetical protein
MMKMGFVAVPSGTDPEGSTTKVIFVVIWEQLNNPDSNSIEFDGIRKQAVSTVFP